MHEASLFNNLERNYVQCLACRHYCHIRPQHTGICGVRQNIDNKLYLTVYGTPVATNVDPIEKKPLYHFLPRSLIFSIGTVGCNFKCSFCQNWDISQASKQNPTTITNWLEQNKNHWPPSRIIEYCLENKIHNIAYTYNEPTIFAEYAYDIMKHAQEHNIKNVFVSNGYSSPETIELIAPFLDGINVDLKAFTENFYQKLCGAHLSPVLETIQQLYENNIWVELTTLVIPGENDSPGELSELATFISSIDRSIPWHISRFFPNYLMDDKPNTPIETLHKAYQIGKEKGLHHVYLGNVRDKEYEHTYCPKCQFKLIERQGYLVKLATNFVNGRCPSCGTTIKGIWS